MTTREQVALAAVGRPGPVRRRVVSIVEAAARDWRRTPDAIDRALREARDLGSIERRVVGDAVHDLVRYLRRYRWLSGGESPVDWLDAWRAERTVEGCAAADERLRAITDPRERLAIAESYPSWLVERWLKAYGGAEAAELARASNHRAPLTVRANRLRASRTQLAERLAGEGIECRPTRLAPDGLVLETHRNVYGLAAFREGWMELQDEASQLGAELCAPPPRGTVVDACAGAGGKTLALGALLDNRGRITALDVSPRKLLELGKRARRAGLTNVTARRIEDARPVALPPADRVLVDAPCSGSGVIRRHPETKWRLALTDIEELAGKQRELLECYAALVRPGGRLVYTTCSVLPEENDAVIDGFLVAHPEFRPVPVKEIVGRQRALEIGDGERLRLFPHRHDTDGFFGAVLRRLG